MGANREQGRRSGMGAGSLETIIRVLDCRSCIVIGFLSRMGSSRMHPIASGEWAVETGTGLLAQGKSRARGFFPLDVLYGLAPNLQVSVGTTLLTDPKHIEGQTKSGDLQLSVAF